MKQPRDSAYFITDGAFYTYYKQIGGVYEICENACLYDSKTVERVHREYYQAGAMLVRTNTFSASRLNPDILEEDLDKILSTSLELAHKAAPNAMIAADIGPLPATDQQGREIPYQTRQSEYLYLAQRFIEYGAQAFVFETFSSVSEVEEVVRYIRQESPNAFILCQFAVLPDGVTNSGQTADKLWEAANQLNCDAIGLNCASGPAHMHHIFTQLHLPENKLVSALPNAGYPQVVGRQLEYPAKPEYFGQMAKEFLSQGVRIIGGCCGTTPEHIRCISQQLGDGQTFEKATVIRSEKTLVKQETRSEVLIAVELDPPYDGNYQKTLKAAHRLKRAGADIITLADSPLGRPRMNSIMLAGIIKREVGIEVMPHLCCRDRNLTALRSDLMGAWALGIRKLLCVTGDPVFAGARDEVKSVFNVNSFELIALLSELNQTLFLQEPITIAGAVNPGAANPTIEKDRMARKAEMGAEVFLSQPVWTQEDIGVLAGYGRPNNCQVYAGLLPPVSKRHAMFLSNEVPGMQLPDMVVDAFDADMTREQAEKVGLTLALNAAFTALEQVDGLYLMIPFNRIGLMEKIIREVKGENLYSEVEL